MNCLMSAWHHYESELRAWLFEVARNALAERPRLRWDQVELPDKPEVSKAECVAIRRLGALQFFYYDTPKALLLLTGIVFVMGIIHTFV